MDNNELLEEDIMLMSDDDTDTDADTVQELSLYANNVYNEDGEKIAEIYGNKVIFEGGFITAQDTSYDNTDTGLTATNVQTAIDEVTDSLNGKADASKVTKNQIDDYLSVSGGTCVLELNSVLGTNFTNYTIPQAYRPSHTIYAPAFVTVGNIRYMGFLGVNPNGALSGYYFTAYASNTSANILGTNYIVANISWNV